MTIDEFFDKLAEATRERCLKWSVKRQSLYRPRALREGPGRFFGDCPIGAVGAHLGKSDHMEYYGSVAEKISLGLADADSIAKAADFDPDYDKLTKRLLKTCGLE